MSSFFLMLGFFTRLPVPCPEYTEQRYRRGVPMLPLVGALVGGLLAGVFVLLESLPAALTSLLVFVLYLYITGGLHLDGLADSFDALFSSRDREGMLRIMDDPQIGSFGVLGLIISSAAYLILFSMVDWPALLLFPIIGKCTPAIAANIAPYIRPGGMAELFCSSASRSVAILAAALGLAACAVFWFMSPKYLLAGAVALAASALLTLKIKKMLGGITGDILGLVCESAHLLFLLLCVVVV